MTSERRATRPKHVDIVAHAIDEIRMFAPVGGNAIPLLVELSELIATKVSKSDVTFNRAKFLKACGWVLTNPSCPRCKGKGQYLLTGDAHRSSGMVPCECRNSKGATRAT